MISYFRKVSKTFYFTPRVFFPLRSIKFLVKKTLFATSAKDSLSKTQLSTVVEINVVIFHLNIVVILLHICLLAVISLCGRIFHLNIVVILLHICLLAVISLCGRIFLLNKKRRFLRQMVNHKPHGCLITKLIKINSLLRLRSIVA